jgi:hypothetical protein
MFRRLVPTALVAVALAWVTGCGPAKLNESRSWDLEAANPRAMDLPAQPKPQTLTVEFSAPEEVSVYVFKEEDAKGDDGLLNASVNAKKALAQKKSKGETFTVDVPENTPVRVIADSGGKSTKVNLKVTNQK